MFSYFSFFTITPLNTQALYTNSISTNITIIMATVYFSDELLLKISKRGYSKSEFVKEAIKEKLEKVKKS